MNRKLLIVGLLVIGATRGLQAQYPYNNFVWVEPHHSSTVFEGWGRGTGAAYLGMAQFVAAQGLAAQHWEFARQQAEYNRLIAQQVRLEMQRTNRELCKSRQSKASPAEVAELQRKLMPQRLNGSVVQRVR